VIVKACHWIVNNDDLVSKIWVLFQGREKESKGERISIACA